jgi:hypothetical protein
MDDKQLRMVGQVVITAIRIAPWVAASMDEEAGEAYTQDANAFLEAVSSLETEYGTWIAKKWAAG